MSEELDKIDAEYVANETARRREGNSPVWREDARQELLKDTPFSERVSAGLADNSLIRGYVRGALAVEDMFTANDPNFDAKAELNKRSNEIDYTMWPQAAKAGSQADFEMLVAVSQELDEKRATSAARGVSAAVANLLANTVDVDTLLFAAIAPAGIAGKAAKISKQFGRVPGAAFGAVSGAATGAASMFVNEVAQNQIGMGYEAQDLPQLLATGLILGGSIGAATGATLSKFEKVANQQIKQMYKDAKIKEGNEKNFQRRKSLLSERLDEVKEEQESTPEALGTTQHFDRPTAEQPEPKGVGSEASPRKDLFGERPTIQTEITEQANSWALNNDVDVKNPVKNFKETKDKVTWYASQLFSAIFPTDFQKLGFNGSEVGMHTAHMLFEDPTGMTRQWAPRSATVATDGHSLEQQLLSLGTMRMRESFKQFASEMGAGRFAAWTDTEVEGLFNRLVAEEADRRRYGSKQTQMFDNPGSRAVRDAMDSLDDMYKTALQQMKDAGVSGAEAIEWKPGWLPRRWSGQALLDLIDSGVPMRSIKGALSRGYIDMYNVTAQEAKAMAGAVIGRMLDDASGTGADLAGMLLAEGRGKLHEALVNNGISSASANRILDLLSPNERGKLRMLKRRTEIDTSIRIGDTEYTLRDLLNNNYMQISSTYARQAAWATSWANVMGIKDVTDWKVRAEVIKQQRIEAGYPAGDTNRYNAWMDDLYGASLGISPNQQANKVIRWGTSISNLALLNQLGLVQGVDTANIIATYGAKTFWDAQTEVRAALKDPLRKKRVGEELFVLGNIIQGEHTLYAGNLNAEFSGTPIQQHQRLLRQDANYRAYIDAWLKNGGKMDVILRAGRELQGFLSGFHFVKHAQMLVQDRAFLLDLHRHIRGDQKISSRRLKDMGFDEATMSKFKEAWKSVELTEDGLSMNFDTWDKESVAALRNIATRVRNQNVQLGLFGEGMSWLDPSVRTLFFNLRNFTVLSFQKQLIRQSMIRDTRLPAYFAWGATLGATLWSARQIINGKEENVTPQNMLRGAVNYNGFTSAVPMVTDPILGLMGLNEFHLGLYAPSSRSFATGYNVIPNIPAADTLNKIANAPHSLWSIMSGDGTVSDVSAVQAAVPMGNMIGMAWAFNALKEHTRDARAAKKKEEKKLEKAKAKEEKAAKPQKQEKINPVNALDKFQALD